MRPSWWPPRIFKTFSWVFCGHQRTPQEWEKAPSSLLRFRAHPQNRVTAFLQWIMSPRALLHCKYAIIRAVAGTRGGSRKWKKFRLRFFDPALVLKIERLHFYNGLCRPVPSHAVNMQSIWPSHGALRICSDSGLRPSWGLPRATSKLQNKFSKKLLNLEAFWGARSALTRGGHGTL